ncbi:hypothetical protein [Mesorhizobium sp. M7A.F.Ca.MR.148.00.0.0]|uniref:hypothetical protein n=1 Tax=Mesorhizobium sp. M7A.F.Ca.MR.148.00.0.0 TaxID=2496775 RepID=UPI000FCAF3B0|nr:hypothetical protein [Mesorhizobium sp. M7A.F.Ca.MR.148.00.0.0]RUV32934.1 hypothetical protein EOB49_32580 [Mesorhizobium sp. M7A.F.Ca.MR.148.00.0.0]
MTVRIVGGNIRDLSYIAANLRPQDKAEIHCQLDGWTPATLALHAMQGPAYVVELDGNPEAAFGAAQLRSGLWIAWSWGTRRMKRCVPRITKFFWEVLGPDVAAQGAWRVEARALASNDLALRWLHRLGATERCRLPAFGKNGEDFILFDWTRETWNHVPIQQATGIEATAADANGYRCRRAEA